MGTNSSSKKKPLRTQNKGLTAQKKKELECILGLCSHASTNKTCPYWNKVVDAEYPEGVQYKLIVRLIGGK